MEQQIFIHGNAKEKLQFSKNAAISQTLSPLVVIAIQKMNIDT